ncbi:hypothetical protein PLESTF_000672400 [Pleodorina starrii]|nr:hypothetical protein PLESTF_000672400 [Pleodorina starrii]
MLTSPVQIGPASPAAARPAALPARRSSSTSAAAAAAARAAPLARLLLLRRSSSSSASIPILAHGRLSLSRSRSPAVRSRPADRSHSRASSRVTTVSPATASPAPTASPSQFGNHRNGSPDDDTAAEEAEAEAEEQQQPQQQQWRQRPPASPPGVSGSEGLRDGEEQEQERGREPSYLAALRRAAGGAAALRVADGPMGRGLFTAAPVRAGTPLLSVPDVFMLIVADPENEPRRGGGGGGGGGGSTQSAGRAVAAADGAEAGDGMRTSGGSGSGAPVDEYDPDYDNEYDPDLFYSAGGHQDYLRRWQETHDLVLPPGLRDLLGASGSLPAPARLALWLMWLRRECGAEAGEEGGVGVGARGDSVDGGEGGGDGGGGGGGEGGVVGGVRFWRNYCASLPQPGDVTCPSVYSEREAAMLQVPDYLQQWRRTRDSLRWLLGVANEVAREDTRTDQETHPHHHHPPPPPPPAPYRLSELCYCYGLATSRCFHLPGRMALVPFADLANHQPLWQARAFPFWRANEGGDGEETEREGERRKVAGKEAGEAGDDVRGRERGSPPSPGPGLGPRGPVSGWFQFRAVQDVGPGEEVCICYSEGGNREQLFSYGFVRTANPYDRVDLNPHQLGQPDQELEGDEEEEGDGGGTWRPADRLPAGIRLCWPAVVAAAGFWAPGPEAEAAAACDESPAALEQSLLRPRERPAGAWAWAGGGAGEGLPRWGGGGGGSGGGGGGMGGGGEGQVEQRLRLQRRRAALLSLPHTAADAAALRRTGLSRSASPEGELRAWVRVEAAGGVAAAGTAAAAAAAERRLLVSQLETVDALTGLVRQVQGEMGTTLSYDEALWRALTRQGSQPPAAGGSLTAEVAAAVQAAFGDGGGGGGGGARWLGALGSVLGFGARRGEPRTPAAVEAAVEEGAVLTPEEVAVYDTPRGRTALLARLEYKRVLAQSAEVLGAYRGAVEGVLRRHF